jgi:hypothetical protein
MPFYCLDNGVHLSQAQPAPSRPSFKGKEEIDVATIITAPDEVFADGFTVYLGGAIDMGKAENWQRQVIEDLDELDELVLLNPRRSRFTEDTLDEQILWELKAMDAASTVLIWFPRNAKAPVSLLEAGLYMRSGKLIVGAEHGYFRRRNLEFTCHYYGVPLWDRLQDLVSEVKSRYYKTK